MLRFNKDSLPGLRAAPSAPRNPATSPAGHRVLSILLGPVVPSFRALSGRLKFAVRRQKINKDSLHVRQDKWLRVKVLGGGSGLRCKIKVKDSGVGLGLKSACTRRRLLSLGIQPNVNSLRSSYTGLYLQNQTLTQGSHTTLADYYGTSLKTTPPP